MHLGFASFNVGNLATPDFGKLATLAESLGYESLWTAEHIVLADLPPGPGVRSATTAFLDSIAVLGYLAACTQRIKLATGVLLLPQHKPQLLAKQLASVDVLSRGRLIVGVGVGSVPEEAQALASPMNNRGARANEYLDAMLALWSMPHPAYSGKHVSFQAVNAYPRPVQEPHPPIVIGGRSEGAYRRTVRYAAGWYGFNMSLDQTRAQISAINAAVERYGRPAELGPVEFTVAPSETLSAALVQDYAAAGVSRLLLRFTNGGSLADAERVIQDNVPSTFGLESS